MKIFVTVKRVPDTETQLKINAAGPDFATDGIKWVVNPFDEIAIEEGLRIKEKHAGTEVVLVPVDGGGHTWLYASQASAQFFASRAV